MCGVTIISIVCVSFVEVKYSALNDAEMFNIWSNNFARNYRKQVEWMSHYCLLLHIGRQQCYVQYWDHCIVSVWNTGLIVRHKCHLQLVAALRLKPHNLYNGINSTD